MCWHLQVHTSLVCTNFSWVGGRWTGSECPNYFNEQSLGMGGGGAVRAYIQTFYTQIALKEDEPLRKIPPWKLISAATSSSRSYDVILFVYTECLTKLLTLMFFLISRLPRGLKIRSWTFSRALSVKSSSHDFLVSTLLSKPNSNSNSIQLKLRLDTVLKGGSKKSKVRKSSPQVMWCYIT